MTNNTINQSGPTPKFFAYQNVTNPNHIGGGYQLVAFNAVDYDTTSSYSTATSYYTVPIAGKYFFYGSLCLTNLAGHPFFTIGVYNLTTNNTYFIFSNLAVIQDSSGLTSVSYSATIEASLNDVIITRAAVDGAHDIGLYGSAITNPKTWFAGYMLPQL